VDDPGVYSVLGPLVLLLGTTSGQVRVASGGRVRTTGGRVRTETKKNRTDFLRRIVRQFYVYRKSRSLSIDWSQRFWSLRPVFEKAQIPVLNCIFPKRKKVVDKFATLQSNRNLILFLTRTPKADTHQAKLSSILFNGVDSGASIG
jgi:hypothetical protein